MIWLLMGLAAADPGRTTGTLLFGNDQQLASLRGSLDYGIVGRVSGLGGVQLEQRSHGATGLVGVRYDLIDSRWWRVGALALGEVQLPRDQNTPLVGRPAGRFGLHAHWLAFWGLAFTGGLERVETFGSAPGTFWGGAGVAVRL